MEYTVLGSEDIPTIDGEVYIKVRPGVDFVYVN